MRHLY